MASRRRLLQIIASSFKWIAHSFTNLYYSLIPTTISGKKVQDKAKVVKVYGNSEVKNQLVTSNNRTKVFETTAVSTKVVQSDLNIPTNNWVLMIWKQQTTLTSNTRNTPVVVMGGNNVYQNASENRNLQAGTYCWLLQTTGVLTWFGFWCHSPNVQNTITDFQFINLTQRYPFDTPTTLTDTRVQKILNGGYEEFNLGEIVDVDMGEIDSEPYNLFDGVMESGRFDLTTGAKVNDATNLRTTNGIKLIGGQTYVFEMKNLLPSGGNVWAHLEDINGNIIAKEEWSTYIDIAQSGNSRDLANSSYKTNRIFVPNKMCVLKFYTTKEYGTVYKNDICIYLLGDGSRTGYADHNDFVDLANFKPTDVMGIKDTFLANRVGYKITKKTASYTFTGNETFVDFDGAGYSMSIVISGMKAPATANDVPNASWDLGTTIARNQMNRDKPEYTISVNTSGRLFIITTKTSSQLASALVGKTITFELATYQVISVPLRHLGMMKLKDIGTWYYSGSNFYAYISGTTIKAVANSPIYCGVLLSVSTTDFNSSNFSINNNGVALQVKDTTIDNTTDFLAKYGDEYIYFETADVVDETSIIIDKGNLSLSYQGAGVGTAHDTMEQTNTEWVFTKANDKYAFTGNESWNFYGSGESPFFYMQYPSEMSNAKQGGNTHPLLTNGIIATMNSSNFRVHLSVNPQLTSSSNMSDYFTNKTVCKFELATPQVIRIPRKHLGVVRIKDLSWSKLPYGFATRSAISGAKTPANNGVQGNIYCSKYITVSRNAIGYSSPWNTVGIAIQQDGVVCISDYANLDSLSENDFLAKYGDTLIFYETQDEVADIDLTILVEAGGTLTSNWFSWVRNQLIENGNFVDISIWSAFGGTLSVSNNVGTLTITSVGGANRLQQNIYPKTNHSYLIKFDIKGSRISKGYIQFGAGIFSLAFDIATSWSNVYFLYTPNSNTEPFRLYINNNNQYLQNGDTIDFRNVNLIDLTVGFGAGKEPTNINDPVIKEILRLGYIPTDVSGTLTNVDSKVLPNIDCKIKCK